MTYLRIRTMGSVGVVVTVLPGFVSCHSTATRQSSVIIDRLSSNPNSPQIAVEPKGNGHAVRTQVEEGRLEAPQDRAPGGAVTEPVPVLYGGIFREGRSRCHGLGSRSMTQMGLPSRSSNAPYQ